jgi:N-dimethylarginine dimethylaminohydrolase
VLSTAKPLKPPFVRDEVATLRSALVATPSSAIERERPLPGEPNAIAERTRAQHAVFVARLAAHGVKTVKLDADPVASLGALCADVAIVVADGAFLMRPSDVNRRREVSAVEAALQNAGIPIVGRIEPPGLLDGGDVLFAPGCVFLGVAEQRAADVGIPGGTHHGNAHGREQLAAFARARGLKVVEVPLAAQVKRLRSVASLIDARTIVYGGGLIDVERFAGFETIELPRGEGYAAGLLVLGPRRVIANLRFREAIPRLAKARIAVDAIDLWEFGKVGATPSSLALALKRG